MLNIIVRDARKVGAVLPEAGGVVAGIPDLDQLHEPTLDGAADENTRDNCVFTSNADCSEFWRPDLHADGDAIKDSIPAYGQGYTGFASQDVVIASGMLEAKWGTHSYRVNGANRDELLATIAALANQGIPSIVTIPSLWGSQPSQPGYNPDHPNFFCHACVYAGETTGGLHVLCNPWGGFLMSYTSAELALRLCFLCAYPVTKEGSEAATMAPLQIAQVGGYFSANADGSWHSIHNGLNIRGGMLDYYRNLPVPPFSGFSVLRLPLTNEIPIGAPKAGTTRQPTFQIFESGAVLAYDPDRVLDNPPGAAAGSPVYFWHIDRAPVLAQLVPPPAPTPAPVPPVNVKAQVATLEADVAALVKALGAQAA